ncbi:MAG: TonB-dependent receptor [Acidobacteriia bacterium]|nr:TonB-dependent receptor [Terriglobia bacterium]
MRSSIKNRLFFLFLICFLLYVSCAWAQTGTTSLHGKALDSAHAVVEGAAVTLANQGQGISRTTTTPSSGEFEFLALPPGTYVLTVEKAGFKKYEQTNLQLLVNVTTSVNVVLQVGAPTTRIEVSGQAPVINTEDATMGIAFGENQVKELPLEGRNVPDLLTLQPGVAYTGNRADTSTSDTRSGAVNGARSDQGNVSLDGIRVNDEGGHAFTSVLPVTLDSVQEFRVTTTNYNANEGGTSGAQVALVTKSGTNQFHGSAYEYHRNTYTSANDYFNKLTELQGCSTLPDPNVCNKAPKLIRNIFGASLGGPIKKDRLFLFMNYEGTRRAEETVSSGEEVPSAAMRDGVLQYLCTDPTQCPGGASFAVQGKSGQTYTPAPGYFALGFQQLQQMDPANAGPDAAAMAYFNSLPAPNSNVTGDGFNYQGFVFASPTHQTQNVYIARADYNITENGNQRLSVMGALRDDASDACGGCQPYYPGQPPQGQTVYHNKGLVVGYSAVLRPSLISSFHYGFVRESFGTIGNSDKPWIVFNFTQGPTRSRNFQRPMHNFSEDLSWVHGKHTLQFGGYVFLMRNPRFDFTSSFNSGSTNSSFTTTSGFADKNTPLNPANNGYPDVDPSFAVSYDYPITDLLGIVTQATTVFNYDRKLNLLPTNAPISRRYAQDSYEPYVQDVWKIKPSLTLTFGLRYSLFSPIWETNGLQVCPNPSLGNWFANRAAAGANGIPSSQDGLLQIDWCGTANGKRAYWNWDYGNLAPRVAFAWAPNKTQGFLSKLLGSGNKSSIRGGFGIVYDRFGQGIVDEFSGNSFGLTTNLTNPITPLGSLPRLTDVNVIPPSLLQSAPGAPSFPETVPTMQELGGSNFGSSLDTALKTPYSYALDFSVERELGAGFSLDLSYVGRLSHRLLGSQDVAQPLNLRDKKSGLDYFSAIQPLAKLYELQGVTDATFSDSMVSPAVVQYWNDMIQVPINGGAYALGAQTGGCGAGPASTTDPVLAVFDFFCGVQGVETTALQALDVPFISGFGNGGIPDATGDANCGQSGHPLCQYYPTPGPNSFYNPQYVSLFTLRSIGFSNYNALQATLRHQMSHGFQFDFNYTYSKSIDLCSDAERSGNYGYLNFNGGCQVFNAWSPNLFRAVSDFDTTHQLNANWVVELPFGRGRAIGYHIGRALDAAIGGWRLSGLFRWTSGFPYTIYNNPADYPTDWYWEGAAVPTVSHVKSGAYHMPDGNVNLFPDPATAESSFNPALPGQVGARNFVRGDGYFGVDLGLSKRWNMPWNEKQSLALRWEVFNVTNSTRFDFNDQNSGSASESNNSIAVPNFGNYTHLMTNPRVMQFALRYEF